MEGPGRLVEEQETGTGHRNRTQKQDTGTDSRRKPPCEKAEVQTMGGLNTRSTHALAHHYHTIGTTVTIFSDE